MRKVDQEVVDNRRNAFGYDERLQQRARRLAAAGAIAFAAGASLISYLEQSPGKHTTAGQLIPPATEISPGGVPYQGPEREDYLRYEFNGHAVFCRVPPEKHVVKDGDTLFDIAQASTGAKDYDMHYMLPTINKLNVDRGLVTDPNDLEVGKPVLTIADCNIYYWLQFDDHMEGTIEDVKNHTFTRVVKQISMATYCW